MREILFRGQTRRKGEKVRLDGSPVDSNWVYGGIFPNNDGGDFAIIYQQEPKIHKFPVYADTVGQYTGLTDKNGKKIFEGDIVSFNYDTSSVKMTDGCWGLDDECTLLYDLEELEVIGNVHDNPELIGGEPE